MTKYHDVIETPEIISLRKRRISI